MQHTLLPTSVKSISHIPGILFLIVNCNKIESVLFFRFEKVHGPKCTQQNIYDDHVKILIPHVINGKNASVLAYGPTGAGMEIAHNITFLNIFIIFSS